MARVHPTALVDPAAQLHESVEVGPYSVIGPGVRAGEGTTIAAHVVIEGDTEIGKGNRIFQFASIGAAPQDLKYRGQPTKLVLGDRNQIREFATLHRGTVEGGGVTRIGSGCLLMAYAHVAHDVQVGDGVILANSTMLAGHVIVEDHAIFGGMTGVHQFVRVGRHAFVSGGSAVGMDVAPYCVASGHRAQLGGLNLVGLQRHGWDETRIRRVKQAYRILFRAGLRLEEAVAKVREELGADPDVGHLLRFVESSERGLARAGTERGAED
jgi:UDP-N-acetylglucosamine acyltransferase